MPSSEADKIHVYHSTFFKGQVVDLVDKNLKNGLNDSYLCLLSMADGLKHSVTGPDSSIEIHALMPYEPENIFSDREGSFAGRLDVQRISDHLFAAVEKLVGQGDFGEKSKYARGLRDEVILPGGEITLEELDTRNRSLALLKKLPWAGELRNVAEAIKRRTLMMIDNIEGERMEPILQRLAEMTRKQVREGTPYAGNFDTYGDSANFRIILNVKRESALITVRKTIYECPNEGQWYLTAETISRWTGEVEGLQVSPTDSAQVRIQGRLKWKVLEQRISEPGMY